MLILCLARPGALAQETAASLRKEHPQVKLLVLAASEDETGVCAMLALGVAGYLLTRKAPQAAVAAVRTVARGEVCLSAQVAAKVAVDRGRGHSEDQHESRLRLPVRRRNPEVQDRHQ